MQLCIFHSSVNSDISTKNKTLYSASCCSIPVWLCFFNGTPKEMFTRSSKATFFHSKKINCDQGMSRSQNDNNIYFYALHFMHHTSSLHNSGGISLLKSYDGFIGGKYDFSIKILLDSSGNHSFSFVRKSAAIGHLLLHSTEKMSFRYRKTWVWENEEKKIIFSVNQSFIPLMGLAYVPLRINLRCFHNIS